MEKSQYDPSDILCPHCRRRIIQSNYLLHQARCQIVSSRVRIEQPTNQQPIKSKHKQEESRQNSANFPRKSIVERKRIFNESEEQKIPCSYCGYQQTLAELDTHPNQCSFRGKSCTYCGQSFPENLMNQHQQICSARIPPTHLMEEEEERQNRYRQHQHQRRQPIPIPQNYFEEEEESDEDDFRVSPFGNFRHFFSQRPSLEPTVYRRIQNVNGTTYIQQSDGRGRVRGHVINNPYYEMQPQFPQMQRGNLRFGQRRRGGSPFQDFFRLLNLMARGQGQQMEQGLTKQELKKLKKIKYEPSPSSKEGEKDLCTICYCEFEPRENIIKLKCNHIYHEECIVKWLQKNAKCPVCKAPQTNRHIPHQE